MPFSSLRSNHHLTASKLLIIINKDSGDIKRVKIMPYIIAHRGASAELPENTLPAIKRAIELKVDFVEFDIRLSRDGIPVVFHDVTTSRIATPGKRHILSDLHMSDIRQLDAGKWFHEDYAGHHIPHLEEILRLQRGPIGLMIEIKEELTEPKLIARAVVSSLRAQPQKEGCGPILVGSFSPDILREFQRIAPDIQLIGIIKIPSKIASFLKLQLARLVIKHTLITPELVNDLKQKEIEVWSYTIDHPSEAKQFIEWGVNGIITNDPRKILNHIS